jgi:hypothetical protein
MHQLNYELLEQLNVIFGYFRENHIKLPDEEKLANLLSKAMTLLAEVQAKTPKTLQYLKPSDDFLQYKKSDKDFTETVFVEGRTRNRLIC